MQESQFQEELQLCQQEVARLKEELHREITHDYLTQTYNRRGLKEKCEYLVEVAKRDGSYLSVALLDVDHFDDINNRHGRSRGDQVIQALADVIKDNTRRVDVVGRFDGEEFTIIMPNTNKIDAIMVAERIRAFVETNPIATLEGVTISCGIATINVNISDATDESYDKLNLWADEALYHAKKSGRNQALHYDDIH
jgi:diguanylate cyclase (GGDEF)-like protein